MISGELFISFLILLIYSVVIYIWIKGWSKVPETKSGIFQQDFEEISACPKISLVICFKNEEIHLPNLIESLYNQSFKDFELIWVNDHSSDNSSFIIQESLSQFANARLLLAEGQGKKMSQKSGILSASGELIITTDADCVPEPDWIFSIVRSYKQNPVSFIMGPVEFYSNQSWWTQLQRLEFISLVASGMASAGAGMPLYCNAANMAFTKEAWKKSLPDLKAEFVSGDDVFLLHSILKRGEKISVLKDKNAMVNTYASPDLISFLRQRSRWLSKASGYRNPSIIAIASLIGVVNIFLIYSFIISIFDQHYWMNFGLIFLGKYLMDSIFLAKVSGFFGQKNDLIMNLLLSVIYPFYVLITGIGGIFKNNKTW